MVLHRQIIYEKISNFRDITKHFFLKLLDQKKKKNGITQEVRVFTEVKLKKYFISNCKFVNAHP